MNRYQRTVSKAKHCGVQFLGPAMFCKAERLRFPTFYPLRINVHYRYYGVDWMNPLDEVACMFGCKSRIRALSVFKKYWPVKEEPFCGISLEGLSCMVEEKVAIESMVEYGQRLGLDMTDYHYDPRESYRRQRSRLRMILMYWRDNVIQAQREKRDALRARKVRMMLLADEMRKNSGTAETSRRQLRALGIVA